MSSLFVSVQGMACPGSTSVYDCLTNLGVCQRRACSTPQRAVQNRTLVTLSEFWGSRSVAKVGLLSGGLILSEFADLNCLVRAGSIRDFPKFFLEVRSTSEFSYVTGFQSDESSKLAVVSRKRSAATLRQNVRSRHPATERESATAQNSSSSVELLSSGQSTLRKLSHFFQKLALQDRRSGELDNIQAEIVFSSYSSLLSSDLYLSSSNLSFLAQLMLPKAACPIVAPQGSALAAQTSFPNTSPTLQEAKLSSLASSRFPVAIGGQLLNNAPMTESTWHDGDLGIQSELALIKPPPSDMENCDKINHVVPQVSESTGDVTAGVLDESGSSGLFEQRVLIRPFQSGTHLDVPISLATNLSSISSGPHAEFCDSAASCVTAKDLGSLENLGTWLEQRLPFGTLQLSEWGVAAGTKRLSNLWCELLEGEISLEDSIPPRRSVHVASVKIRNDVGHVLVEAYQQMADGRMRPRNRPLSEKMRPGENVQDACLRGIFEELGCRLGASERVTMLPESYRREEEERESFSYPGLLTRYVIHTMVAHVLQLPVSEFATEEDESGHGSGGLGVSPGVHVKRDGFETAVGVKRHFWRWVPESELIC